MTQETKFARSYNELQKILDEIGYLSRSDLALDEYLGQFLKLTLAAIGGQGGAIWMTQETGFQPVYAVNFAETGFEADELQRQSIYNAVRDAAQNSRPVVVAGRSDAEAALQEPKANGIVNRTAFPFFYVPIMMKEDAGTVSAMAVLQIWASPQVDPKSYKDFVAFLQGAAKHAAVFLRARRAESLAGTTDKLNHLLRLAIELSGQLDTVPLAVAIVNRGREITGCDRCALFGINTDGKVRALAVSNVETVDRKSALVQAQLKLAEDTLAAGQPTLYRKSAPKTEAQGEIADYFFHSEAQEALVIPLVGRDGKKTGVLLLESHRDKTFYPVMRQLGAAVATQAGRALAAAQEINAIPFLTLIKRGQRAIEALRADRRKWLLLKVGLPVAAVAVVALLPWRFSVGGECSVVPRDRATAVTEVGGRVVEVFVNEGQVVSKGQPLARIDDLDLQQALRVAEQEKAKYEAEADHLQVLAEEGGRRVAMLQADQVQRQIEQIQRRLAKTSITSPINGVIVTKDLPSRTGELLPLGGRFCDIADLSRWEVVTRLSESDVGLVDDKLRRGERLTAQFLLRSMPNRNLTATISDVKAISQLSYQIPRANVFLVRAEVSALPELQTALKTGYTGQCKVRLGWRPLGYLASRRFLNYIRVHWLF